jgi:hypothetical protein
MLTLTFNYPPCSYFFPPAKVVLLKAVHPLIISIHNFRVPRWLVQFLRSPHKSGSRPFWNSWSYGMKNYGIEITFNGMTFESVGKIFTKFSRKTIFSNPVGSITVKCNSLRRAGHVSRTWTRNKYNIMVLEVLEQVHLENWNLLILMEGHWLGSVNKVLKRMSVSKTKK